MYKRHHTCLLVLLWCLQLSLSLVFIRSLLLMLMSRSSSPSYVHTQSPPPPSFVLVLLCLVSIKSHRVKDWGPSTPLPGGHPEAASVCREALDGGPSAALPSSNCRRSLAFSDVRGDVHALIRANNNNRTMCVLRCARLRCVSLFMLAAVAAMLLLLFVCLHLDISGGGAQVRTEPAARWTTLAGCLHVGAESPSVMSF